MRKVQRYHWDVLSLYVTPDIYFCPRQYRVNSNMRAGWEIGVILIPNLGGLLLEVPLRVDPSWAEYSLFCSSSFFVASNACYYGLKILLFYQSGNNGSIRYT